MAKRTLARPLQKATAQPKPHTPALHQPPHPPTQRASVRGAIWNRSVSPRSLPHHTHHSTPVSP